MPCQGIIPIILYLGSFGAAKSRDFHALFDSRAKPRVSSETALLNQAVAFNGNKQHFFELSSFPQCYRIFNFDELFIFFFIPSYPSAVQADYGLSQVFLERPQLGPGDPAIPSTACSRVCSPQEGHWAPREASLGRKNSSKSLPHLEQWKVYMGMALLTSFCFVFLSHRVLSSCLISFCLLAPSPLVLPRRSPSPPV